MLIEFVTEITDDGVDKRDALYFEGKGILLEDWDYMLIMDYDPELFNADNSPKDERLDQLLRGGYDNTWNRIFYRGKEVIIGVSYHC